MTHPILTRRQMEVLELFRTDQRMRYVDMARRLGCSRRTIRAHVEAIAASLPWPEMTPRRAIRRYLSAQSD